MMRFSCESRSAHVILPSAGELSERPQMSSLGLDVGPKDAFGRVNFKSLPLGEDRTK